METLGTELVEKLTHLHIDGVCGLGAPRLADFSKELTTAQWFETGALLRKAILGASKLEEAGASEALESTCIPTQHATIVAGAIKSRSKELRAAAIAKTVKIGGGVLVDYDWNLKVAVSSDSLASLEEKLLQLVLNVQYPDRPLEQIRMELSHSELNVLITNLDSANKVVRGFRV